MACKPPPPNKLPPPPPPPPLPKPPPPPPPRNSSQLIACQNNAPIGQSCGGNVSSQSANGVLNSGSSAGSLNTTGRCGHSQLNVTGVIPPQLCQRNLNKFNENCSSRSSVSSHSSMQHHHHGNNNHPVPNPSMGTTNFSSICTHGCSCQTSLMQHNHITSSSMSDNGSCTYGINYRAQGSSNCGGCCSNNVNHVHNLTPKCQQSQGTLNMTAIARGNGVSGGPISTTISRNALFHTNENTNPNLSNQNSETRIRCQQSSCTHQHHHHSLHDNQIVTTPGLQPVDGSFHRCHAAQSNTISSLPSLMTDQIQRPSTNSHCNHVHRVNTCNHHHQNANFCDHHVHPPNQQQHPHQFGCLHSHHGRGSPDVMLGKTFVACNSSRHCPQSSIHANRSSDMSNNDSLLSTTHTHNLSNSSTTTHTSNVAVKHQPQTFVHPPLSRGNQSNSSQHYDQYGQSSAASTSSATASLSNYQMRAGSEDRIPLYPSKIHQPLPAPPTRMFNSSTNNSNFNGNMNYLNNNHIPVMTTTLINTSQGSQSMHPLPPLPPKPNSPNASSCSTQITTVTSSPSLSNLPVTRVTSQAGVQNPLPESDTPPPLPPLNPCSRPQQSINPHTTRAHPQLCPPTHITNQQLVNFNPSAIRNNGHMTEAERKTEMLTRQVESELEKKNSDPNGICFKCGEKVVPAQGDACRAMNKIYHANCFRCCKCNRTLLGETFYPVLDKVYCEEDYKVGFLSLEFLLNLMSFSNIRFHLTPSTLDTRSLWRSALHARNLS